LTIENEGVEVEVKDRARRAMLKSIEKVNRHISWKLFMKMWTSYHVVFPLTVYRDEPSLWIKIEE
jgi:hypothetical protein